MKIIHLCLCGQYNEQMGYQDNIIPIFHSKEGNDVFIIASALKFDLSSNNKIVDVKPTSSYFDNINIIRLKFFLDGIFPRRLRVYSGLYASINRIKPDCIFIHGVQFLDALVIWYYKYRNPKVRISADNHSDYYNSAQNWLSLYVQHKILWKFTARLIEHISYRVYGVTPLRCHFLKDVYGLKASSIELLPLGADDRKFNLDDRESIRLKIRSELGLSEQDFVIITGGKIDGKKNFSLLIEALNVVIKKYDRKIILLVFGSYDICTKKLIADSDYIMDLGWLSSDYVYNYYFTADLAVFPGLHSVLWEQACAAKIPSIFQKLEGMTHVDVGGNCILLENINVDSLISELSKLMISENFLKLKNTALEADTSMFNYSVIAQKILKDMIQ